MPGGVPARGAPGSSTRSPMAPRLHIPHTEPRLIFFISKIPDQYPFDHQPLLASPRHLRVPSHQSDLAGPISLYPNLNPAQLASQKGRPLFKNPDPPPHSPYKFCSYQPLVFSYSNKSVLLGCNKNKSAYNYRWWASPSIYIFPVCHRHSQCLLSLRRLVSKGCSS